MIKFPLLFGAIRHMKLVGEDPQHRALRYRNEQRLAALKAANRLYEVKSEQPTSARHPATNVYGTTDFLKLAYYQRGTGYEAGSALAGILGVSGQYFGTE